MDNYSKLANRIIEEMGALSVFIYGSIARGEVLRTSDAEIGIIFSENKYQKRKDLQEKYGDKGISLFPFKERDILSGMFDTPFQKRLYIRDLVLSAKTLAGKKIIENLNLPEIKVMDLIQEVRFNLGYALAATHSQRNNDEKTAALHFSKSCIYGARNLIILEKKIFPKTYKQIKDEIKGLVSEEHYELISEALKVRETGKITDSTLLFKNISFLNLFVEKRLLDFFSRNGNEVLIK